MRESTVFGFMGAGVVVWLMGVILLATGYVMNIMDLIRDQHEPFGLLMLLRVIGLFVPPLGAILGFAT